MADIQTRAKDREMCASKLQPGLVSHWSRKWSELPNNHRAQ